MKPVQGKTKVKRSRIHGWGVFAIRDIRNGETIEQMPALCILEKHITVYGERALYSPLNTHAYHPTGYPERWIGTGTLSFYNAAQDYNADHEFSLGINDEEGDWITIYANRKIKAGEEITLDYLQDSDS